MTFITANVMKRQLKNNKSKPTTPMPFDKTNYLWMWIGLACIALGFFLMTGPDANTRPDGNFDPNYWNEDIFSFVRIRLSPILIVGGFAIEVFAILKISKSNG